jgi:hypothetical protein
MATAHESEKRDAKSKKDRSKVNSFYVRNCWSSC